MFLINVSFLLPLTTQTPGSDVELVQTMLTEVGGIGNKDVKGVTIRTRRQHIAVIFTRS